MTIDVIALPGGVMPAPMRYAALASALSSDVRLNLKDLEVYATAEPPSDYSLDLEVSGVLREAYAVPANECETA